MNNRHRNRDRGFTLVEMMVTLVIVAIATFSIFRVFSATNETYKKGTESIDGQQNTRAALTWLSRELRSSKGFTFISNDELTLQSDRNVPNQIRTFRLDEDDQDGDGDTNELLLIRNPDDNGTPGVFVDEIAVGIDSVRFVYRDGSGQITQSRVAVQEVEVLIYATGNSMREEERDETHGIREVAMSTRVRCRNLGKSVPTLGDVTPPYPPTLITALMGCATATISWTASPDEDVAGYYLHYNGGSSGTPYSGTDAEQGPSPIFVGNVTSYTLTGLDLNDTYYFNLQAIDAADNSSTYGSEASGVPQDILPPSTPANFTGRVVANDQIQLSWSRVSDWDVAWYKVVWFDDVNLTTAHVDSTESTSLLLTGLSPNAVHVFTVAAIDHCGNEGIPSTPITVTMTPCEEDVDFPDIPEDFATTPGDEFVRLTWTLVSDPDVVGYQVYFQESGGYASTLLVGNVDTYSVYGLTNGVPYQFQVAALDGCGQLGGYTGLESATPYQCAENSSPPGAPANVTPQDLGTGSEVKVSWARGQEGDVLGYVVYWGSDAANLTNYTDVGDDIFYTVGGLTAGTTYYFAVSSYDICGNSSSHTTPAAATPTWGCACPPLVKISEPTPYEIVQGTVEWTVTAGACSSGTVSHVEFRIDGSTRFVDYTPPFEFGDFGGGWSTTFEENGAHQLVAVAADDNSCESADTISVYVDNTGLGVACLGIPEGESATVAGSFDEKLEFPAENQSSIDTYSLAGVVFDWDDPNATLMNLWIEGSSVWGATGFPGASSGDTLWLTWEYSVYPDDEVTVDAEFGDVGQNSPPVLDLASATVDVTFLGQPLSPCGPYPLPIQEEDCFPAVSIYAVNSSNSYNVWGVPSIGDNYYTDRSYVLTYIPSEIANTSLVRTPNNDKNTGDSHKLELDFEQDVTVYIAYDPRGNPPDWIENEYTNTGLTIGVTDSGTSTLGLWKKDLDAGVQIFKGNKAAGWGGGVGTNYILFIKCREGAS